MANNHIQFTAFNETITSSKRATLKSNRNALRNKIRTYFKNNWPEKIQPKFHGQGSYAMHTILNPLNDDKDLGAYDLDDGVYFIGTSEDDRETINWYHNEVYEAVKNHTSKGAVNNAPCITVEYADGHHIDLPIYFMLEDDEHPQLAHKDSGWLDSDPREMTKWFNGREEHPQLRRLVKYLKAWANYIQYANEKIKMPSGCILTMLAVEFYESNDRDDIAMRNLLCSMYDNLSAEDGFHCYRPTFPDGEDLFSSYNKTRKQNFLAALKKFRDDANRAINNTNPKEGCLKWQKHFGDRFSCSTAKDIDEDAKKQENAGIIKNNSRFA